jgi:hypothetical protein
MLGLNIVSSIETVGAAIEKREGRAHAGLAVVRAARKAIAGGAK